MPVLLVTKLILKKSKSSQKSHRRSKNSEPCNPNFFHDKSELEVVLFQALVGGGKITLQNLPNFDEFKRILLLLKL